EGRTIGLSTRYQHFETWNWHEKALEMEGPLGEKALPVLGALLFRSGWTGLSSRAPLLL
ncbi:Cytosine-specific methyltransferase, partial [Durusdinium trenchii]